MILIKIGYLGNPKIYKRRQSPKSPQIFGLFLLPRTFIIWPHWKQLTSLLVKCRRNTLHQQSTCPQLNIFERNLKTLWLDVPIHMTIINQSEAIICLLFGSRESGFESTNSKVKFLNFEISLNLIWKLPFRKIFNKCMKIVLINKFRYLR